MNVAARRRPLTVFLLMLLMLDILIGKAGGCDVARASAAPFVVAEIGDSLTRGYGSTDDMGWRGQFDALLTAAGVNVQSRYLAVGGWTTARMNSGLGAWLEVVKPDLVILAPGTNDSPSVFEADYRQMVAVTLDMTHAKVGGVFLGYPTSPSLAAAVSSNNDAVYRSMYAYGYPGGRWAGVGDWQGVAPGPDGVHPGDVGYAKYARQLYRGFQVVEGWPVIPVEVPALVSRRP